MSSSVREREHDDEGLQRDSKRQKVNEQATETVTITEESLLDEESLAHEHVLPPSHALLGIPLPVAEQGRPLNFLESDVGISEYVGRGVSRIDGIIKQRFTDFLVYEVDLDSNVIHLKSLAKPDSSKKNITEADVEANTPAAQQDQDESMQDVQSEEKPKEEAQSAENPTTEATPTAGTSEETQQSTAPPIDSKEPWPESFTIKLIPFLSESAIAQLKEMFLQGPEPPRISDSGWGSRAGKSSTTDEPVSPPPPEEPIDKGKGERGGRGRGGRGGRGGGRGGSGREDHRKVLSEPIESKETRTAFHKVIRDLFKGKLETETDTSSSNTDEGSRIVIKWSRRGVGRGGRERKDGNGAQGDRPDRGTYPPYIHFTLQKTNRDTQDALSHLSRILHVNVKDLSVAGTKDKRGVTVQRVSLKRGNKIVEDIWRLGNSISRQKSEKDALIQRGERGVRIADLVYRKASLELGMLKGNAFVITLRNVQVDSMETLEKALTIVKNNGFINYYGMQRFGTASVPTHAIGLALLKSEWHKAVSLILQTRYGEHPEVEAARNAWLKEKDLDKALRLMPRRVVAERCILESYRKQKGDTRNAMGALSTIPRNLRLMYIHAYQSYVWNAIVSERIRMYGAEKPVAGDLVFEAEPETSVETGYQNQNEDEETNEPNEQISNRQRKKQSRKPWSPPRVKTLTDEDLGNYSIFDVIMPLPGTDVAYPGGELGERYKEFLEMDGLDPNNFVRKQKDYTLGGSYRKILHQPKEMSWSVLRYTDPDVPLAQADEDKLLGFDPPAVVENGKFMALQINLQLGTASYATMALREITKAETSSHYQTNLTAAAEDQKYRGVATAGVDEENEEREIDEPVTEGAEAMEES